MYRRREPRLSELLQPVKLLHPVREAAGLLGISVWTLRKWAYQGNVTSIKIGAKLQIPESEIERLICEGLRPRRVRTAERSVKAFQKSLSPTQSRAKLVLSSRRLIPESAGNG